MENVLDPRNFYILKWFFHQVEPNMKIDADKRKIENEDKDYNTQISLGLSVYPFYVFEQFLRNIPSRLIDILLSSLNPQTESLMEPIMIIFLLNNILSKIALPINSLYLEEAQIHLTYQKEINDGSYKVDH